MRNGRKALWGALICVFALVFSGCSGNAPAAEQNIKVQITGNRVTMADGTELQLAVANRLKVYETTFEIEDGLLYVTLVDNEVETRYRTKIDATALACSNQQKQAGTSVLIYVFRDDTLIYTLNHSWLSGYLTKSEVEEKFGSLTEVKG